MLSELDNCKKYDNLMSLKLDGLLDAEKERVLDSHIARCPQCAPMWEAMVEAEKMLWSWVSEPLPVPANFHVKVMERVATSAVTHVQVAPVYGGIAVPQPTRPLPILPTTGPLTGGLTGPLTMRLAEWQGRIAPYVRWVAAGVLALTSMAGLVMALVVSGVLTFEGEMAGVAGAFRTFFQAADTWVRSLFVGIGPGMFVVAGIILGLLMLAGWQVASAYQRSVIEQRRGSTGYLEALT
ncbi:MAG TPA: zf-HC2 domain-containing protein [Chloroflexia bacterium]|nr:zf-HC2 domain-containing protein [Chloroflexia bacterium]